MNITKKAQLKGHHAAVFAISATDNPSFFLSGSGEGWIVQWDINNPETGILRAKVDTQIFSLLQLRATQTVVAGDMNGGIHWVDLDQPANTRNIAHHRKGVFSLLQIENFLYSAGGEGRITRWSVPEARSLESLQLSHQSLRSLDFCPRSREIAAGASDGNIYLLDADTLELKQTLEGAHSNSVFCVRYHPGGGYLLSGGRDAHLRVWDTRTWKLHSEQPAHWFTINDIVFAPQGSFFATASRDKTIKIWDGEKFELLKVLDTLRHGGHPNSVNCLIWSDRVLISGSDDRTLIIWEQAPKEAGLYTPLQ